REAGRVNEDDSGRDWLVGRPRRLHALRDDDLLVLGPDAERVHLLDAGVADSFAGQDDRVVVGRLERHRCSAVEAAPPAVRWPPALPLSVRDQPYTPGHFDG